MNAPFQNNEAFAKQLDEQDSLRSFRNKFLIPSHNGNEAVYFLGNSLGLQPKTAKDEINAILDQWAMYGVEGFFMGGKPWMHYHDALTNQLAVITGALPHEITVMNQLTVNLHLMLVSFYNPAGKKKKILCEAKAFPSDQYMLETHVRQRGLAPDEVIIEVQPDEGTHTISTEKILQSIVQHKDELALVLFSGVNYYTGQVFDMKAITAAAHDAGVLVGFDLAHAAGNLSLQLHDWNVDFACWCSYKYLNSGPGAVGAAYVHERFHNDKNLNRFAGWWGYDKANRFKMEKGFVPMKNAEGWQLSTPSLLLYAAHKASLDIFAAAGWENILKKKELLTAYLWFVIKSIKGVDEHIEFITPENSSEHGCQVSMLMLQNGRKVFDALSANGIMADWREPDVIRIAPVPLYNSFTDVWKFGNTLQQILKSSS